jgi:hypothetical protein
VEQRKRNIRNQGKASGASDVDPDQPFPQDPAPNGPADTDDRNVDEAFEGKEHGEGNYRAADQYRRGVRSFVRSGRVGGAARAAQPKDAKEAHELERAEAQGRKHAKGEDPAPGKRRSS